VRNSLSTRSLGQNRLGDGSKGVSKIIAKKKTSGGDIPRRTRDCLSRLIDGLEARPAGIRGRKPVLPLYIMLRSLLIIGTKLLRTTIFTSPEACAQI
jgi:hypothetical protein